MKKAVVKFKARIVKVSPESEWALVHAYTDSDYLECESRFFYQWVANSNFQPGDKGLLNQEVNPHRLGEPPKFYFTKE